MMQLDYTPNNTEIQSFDINEDDCQDGSWDPLYKREKLGNNKKKISRCVKKAKKKMAQQSKRKNRK